MIKFHLALKLQHYADAVRKCEFGSVFVARQILSSKKTGKPAWDLIEIQLEQEFS